MALDNKHPLYSTFLTDWKLCRDSYRGERVVKEARTLYLPATSGMEADGMKNTTDAGYLAYNAYLARAVFPDVVAQAVENYIGMMWSKPPTIELPAKMEPMRQHATTKGESLEQLLRRINEQQLVAGRLGLLLDLPPVPNPDHLFPYVATYNTEDIINWDNGAVEDVTDSLNLVVLDEGEYVRDADFEWTYENKYRVLVKGDLADNEQLEGKYSVALFTDNNTSFNSLALQQPSIRGNKLDKIPFVFVNSKDMVAEPDDPPLLGLARLAMAIYRGEADYRQALFLQGQDTLVIIGGSGDDDEDKRIGAGAALQLTDGGDAKFIGVSSDGLSEQRQAIENDKQEAAKKSGELSDKNNSAESGDALHKRISAQTATLNQIAKTGAESLQSILRCAAEWVGADPEEVVVTPNLDFTPMEIKGEELVKLMTGKTLGAPISMATIHEQMQEKGLTKYTLEEELALIEAEEPLIDGTEEGDDPEDDDDDDNKNKKKDEQ